MKAIVGLGNPGPKYAGTRHNVGFAVADELARRQDVGFESAPVEALIAKWRREREPGGPGAPWAPGAADVLIAKPLTFMNDSGRAVGALLRYFRIDLADLLIIVDEVQLPLGRLRARKGGSAGGHNGLKSVIAHVGDDFARLRIGVGRGDSRRDLADHVLARFERDEAAEADRQTKRAAEAAEMFVTAGIAAVMNGFNGGDPATIE
jgi:peptidyl-tRNA hydrolase, PTH1 family